MDVLKKAELAKQTASSQASPEPDSASPWLTEEPLVLDENALQPPLGLLEEATEEAELYRAELEAELDKAAIETPDRQYAYEWVDDLDLPEAEGESEGKDVGVGEDRATYDDATQAIINFDTDRPSDPISPAEAPAPIPDHALDTVPDPVADQQLNNIPEQVAQVPDAGTSTAKEVKPEAINAASSTPIEWVDDVNDTENDEARSRLAAEELLRAEGATRLHKKASHAPLLLGFLVVILLLLGGIYIALNTLLEDFSSASLLTTEGAERSERLQARLRAAGCAGMDLACLNAYEARQTQADALPSTDNADKAAAAHANSADPTETQTTASATPANTTANTTASTTASNENTRSEAPPAAEPEKPAKPKEASTKNLLQAKRAAQPANNVQELEAERPEGRFYQGMKKYELQALAEQGFFIRRQTAPPHLQTQLNQAYSAYQSKQIERATSLYQAVLEQQPHNRDALLGIAAIAQQQEQIEQARAYYQRVLQLHPNDAVASNGLLSLAQQPSIEQEQQLREQLAQQADAHWLHFALGNLYSRQARWREAQEAYFQAYRHQPQQPDYLYNLAVSLEHLKQARTALGFYEEALKYVNQGNAAHFEPASVQRRIALLKAQQAD